MRELEHRFPDHLAVVGVHSGKYIAERDSARIREAAARLDVPHPVVNDRQFRVWRSYAVDAWPTVYLVDPTGRALGSHAGEFTADMLAPIVEKLVAAFGEAGQLDPRPLGAAPDSPAVAPGRLRYPGKVALDADGDRIAVADSGQHRVLVGRLTGDGRTMRVERVVGTGSRGFEDGARGSFDTPQGLAFGGDTLYVADAENHAVRAVDLATGAVRTLAGTGRQLRTMDDIEGGAMSSPWDVALAGDTLFIAMAGIHQIWSLDLASSEVMRHAGSRREDIVDGPHWDAALAQPMGIVARGDTLYFADAESSAVRSAGVETDGEVRTIVGTGLFDFGDKDGAGDEVRMQHQQGLALHSSGRLLVCDSYNDALKWVDPATRRAESWVRGLHEPSGVACGDRYAYVADTNAHRVVAVEYETGGIEELVIDDR